MPNLAIATPPWGIVHATVAIVRLPGAAAETCTTSFGGPATNLSYQTSDFCHITTPGTVIPSVEGAVQND